MENDKEKKGPATIENAPLKNTGTEKADQCETVKSLNKEQEETNKTQSVKLGDIEKYLTEKITKNILKDANGLNLDGINKKVEPFIAISPVLKTPNLVAAINQVMREVKNIEKNSSVGAGQNAFNAVSDKDVKEQIGQAMERAGLALIPISVEPTAHVERFPDPFNPKKQKKDVFTEVKTKYLLMHEGGQQIEFAGYGQGVDSMDKSAGKATTYALKYALLYLFMVPTGKIADADKTQPTAPAPEIKQTLNDGQFSKAISAIENGSYTKEQLKADYSLNPAQLEKAK